MNKFVIIFMIVCGVIFSSTTALVSGMHGASHQSNQSLCSDHKTSEADSYGCKLSSSCSLHCFLTEKVEHINILMTFDLKISSPSGYISRVLSPLERPPNLLIQY